MKKFLLFFFLTIFLFSSVAFSGCVVQEKKQRSGLQVESGNNQQMSLFIEGSYINQTPLIEKNLKPGTYNFKLVPTDPTLAPFEGSINLHPGTVSWIIWNPGPTQETSGGTFLEMQVNSSNDNSWLSLLNNEEQNENEGKIIIRSTPEKAIISINNEEQVRFAPTEISLKSPENIVYNATLPSYETQAHTIAPQLGYTITLTTKLARKDPELLAQAELATQNSSDLSSTPSSEVLGTSSAILRILPTNFKINGQEVLRMRESPNAQSNTIEYLPVNNNYQYLEERVGDWIKIKTATQSGWVSSSFTDFQSSGSAFQP